MIKQMQNQSIPHWPLLCLFDSRSTLTWIKMLTVPMEAASAVGEQPIIGSTMAGEFQSNKTIQLQQISIPEFSPT